MKSKVQKPLIERETTDMLEYYVVHLAFDLATKSILPHPYSVCRCYDGRHNCSHLGGLILFFRCAQRCDSNQEYFENKFPENPIKLQDSISLIENVCMSPAYKKSKKAKSHRKQQCVVWKQRR